VGGKGENEMYVNTENALIVSAVDFEKIQAIMETLKTECDKWLLEAEYTVPDGKFKFSYRYDRLPDGRVLLDSSVSYPDNLGSPYLTGHSDNFDDLLDENKIIYERIPMIDEDKLRKFPIVSGDGPIAICDRHSIRLHNVGDII
jgi:hypothetical protein